jgi:hypothetical protein
MIQTLMNSNKQMIYQVVLPIQLNDHASGCAWNFSFFVLFSFEQVATKSK